MNINLMKCSRCNIVSSWLPDTCAVFQQAGGAACSGPVPGSTRPLFNGSIRTAAAPAEAAASLPLFGRQMRDDRAALGQLLLPA